MVGFMNVIVDRLPFRRDDLLQCYDTNAHFTIEPESFGDHLYYQLRQVLKCGGITNTVRSPFSMHQALLRELLASYLETSSQAPYKTNLYVHPRLVKAVVNGGNRMVADEVPESCPSVAVSLVTRLCLRNLFDSLDSQLLAARLQPERWTAAGCEEEYAEEADAHSGEILYRSFSFRDESR